MFCAYCLLMNFVCIYARFVTEGVIVYEILSVWGQITCVLVGMLVTLLNFE